MSIELKRFNVIMDGHYPDKNDREYCDDGKFVEAKVAFMLLDALQSLLKDVENVWLNEYFDEAGNTCYYHEWTIYDKYLNIVAKNKKKI